MSQEILKQFDFEGQPIRTVLSGNEPWFVASDVCKALGIQNTKQALYSASKEDVRSTYILDRLGRPRQVNTVNETGLCDMLLKSRKPKAKALRNWMMEEVLPF